ncbi:MAG: acyloxyacyl hydrolase [Bacteroidia bacterium]
MRVLTALLFFCLVYTSVYSQADNPYSYYMRTSANYGYIMQHRNSMGHLIKGHIYGGEIDYVLPTKGDEVWHYENNFPEKGIAFSYYNLGNPEQLGSLYAIAPFYEIPLKARKSPSRLYLRLSSGLAYATKRFDPIANHKNNVISVNFNAFVNFKWFYQFDITNRLRLEAGLNFSHASNGKYKAPNLGINMLTLNSGLIYKFRSKKEIAPVICSDSSSCAPSRHEIYALAAIGFNEVEPPGGAKYAAETYTLGYYYNRRNTHKFGGGLDLYYLGAVAEEIYREDSVRYSNPARYIQVGAKFSYCYNVGRTVFPVEFGYYLKTPYLGDGLFFHRIGVRHYLKNNIILNFSLKTHWAVASFFEFGAGYRIPLKKKK